MSLLSAANSLFPQQSLSPKLINSFNMLAMTGCKDLNFNPLDKFQIVQGDFFFTLRAKSGKTLIEGENTKISKSVELIKALTSAASVILHVAYSVLG